MTDVFFYKKWSHDGFFVAIAKLMLALLLLNGVSSMSKSMIASIVNV